ncbi:MAG: CCA tRNA nucleotidyltransferase [Bryobacterales bacterium]|nr:CCA tRNA nucleotidyltransferase [Bryobacterales bacterium]MBV9401351.1 CCA tRNA nucleotidyltransferase [Bryobacterales bacterium]
MSDYMFMLESHLSADQFRVVGEVRDLASAAGLSVFLTGGAMRDMLGGFPVRDLDFTVEGAALKFARSVEQKHGVKVESTDELRKCAELRFPNGVTAEIGQAHSEKFAKSGGRPQVAPATIHEDLRCRDFTINAIALSLNKASLGLLIDPTNGAGDIERKELRAIQNYSFYDDPARMLGLIRFKVRLGYAVDERTKLQFENAREADMLTRITPEALGAEFRRIASEPSPHDLLRALEEERLTQLFCATLVGPKLNLPVFSRLQKARQLAPFGWDLRIHALPLFLTVLFEKLNPKERSELATNTSLSKADVAAVQKLETAAKKLERDLKAPKLQKPSLLYQAISKAPGEQVMYLAVYSEQRIVQDRIRNYFQKYLPAAGEVTDEMVAAAGIAPGSPKFLKAKEEMVLKRLDARPKKPEPVPEPPPPPPMSSFARGSGFRQAR